MLYTTDGLVLRETAVGENDKIINLMAAHYISWEPTWVTG